MRKRLTGVCACGGPKDEKSKRCFACLDAKRRIQKLARMRVPRQCACGRAAEPSPFHCFCKRWKPAAAVFCEACVA